MDEIVYVDQDHGIGWAEIIDEEHEKGYGRQKAILRSSNHIPE